MFINGACQLLPGSIVSREIGIGSITDQRMQRMSIEDTKREKNLRFRFLRSVMWVK